MVGVCCGCVALPASVQPRKTYNNLVPPLFGGDALKPDAPLDSTLRNKIKKLQEYAQKSPAKIPKVSRRLMRRIRASLRRPVDGLGHVKIAVHALVYMLMLGADEGSSYTAGFFAKELVKSPDAVVPTLLSDPHIEMRTLGAELLSVFSSVQTEADTHLAAIQSMVPLVCRAARAALHAEDAGAAVEEVVRRRREGDKLAVPNPIDLINRRAPEHVAALEAACLRCLCEIVALAARDKVAPDHLEDMQAVALDNLRRSADSQGGPAMGGPPERPAAGGGDGAAAAPGEGAGGAAAAGGGAGAGCVIDYAFYAAAGIAGRVPGGSDERALAARLLRLLVGFVRDVSTVYEVMATFYRYMDAKRQWREPRIMEAFMSAIRASGTHHHFPIFSSLLRHACAGGLPPRDAAAALRAAAQQARRLAPQHAMPALAAALQEVPRAVVRGGGGGGSGGGDAGEGVLELHDAAAALLRGLAGRVGSPAELSEALAACLAVAAEGVGGGSGGAAATAAAAAALAAADDAAQEWVSAARGRGSGGGGGSGAPARAAGGSASAAAELPSGVLPPSLVAAVVAVCDASPELRWPALRVLSRVLRLAPKGVRSDRQGAALAAAALAAVTCDDAAAWRAAAPADVAAADRALRACLPGGPEARPETELAVAQALLHAFRRWGAAGGFAAAGGGDAGRGAAALGAAAAAARLVGAAAGVALPPLPLAADCGSNLMATPAGLSAVDGVAAFPSPPPPTAAAALAALGEAVPPDVWASQAAAALAGAPGLRAEFGEAALADALERPPGGGKGAAGAGAGGGGSGGDAKSPLTDRVNALLAKRISTLRRDFARVADLARDAHAPSSSASGAGPSPAPGSVTSAGGGGGGAAAVAASAGAGAGAAAAGGGAGRAAASAGASLDGGPAAASGHGGSGGGGAGAVPGGGEGDDLASVALSHTAVAADSISHRSLPLSNASPPPGSPGAGVAARGGKAGRAAGSGGGVRPEDVRVALARSQQ